MFREIYRPKAAALIFYLFLLLSSLLLVSCDSGPFSNASWQVSGLQGQQLRVVEVSGQDSTTLYTANEQGHVFVSTDAGQRWSEQSSGLPLPNAIHALSFATSSQKLYAATEKGLFIKAESATAWQKITAASLPSTSFTALTFLPDAANMIYVGTASQGIYVSHDGGTSWLAANSGLPQGIAVNDLSADPVQKQIWAATSVGAYRSANSGASWQSFNNGLPSHQSVNTIVSAATGGGAQGMLYMGTDHGILLSYDFGAHWKVNSEALSGVIIHRILVDFRSSNGGTVYIATSLGVFRSTDSGQNWGSVATGLPKNAAVYALVIGAANNAQVYAAGNGFYEFPGTGSSIDPLRIFTYLLVVVFFFLLYRLVMRGRGAARRMLKPVPGQGTPTAPDDASHSA